MIAWFGVFVIWIAGRESYINFARVSYHAGRAREPTWVPSPRAVPTLTAYCLEWFDDMEADWFDIDYSAFAYDRDFEEDLCIEDFSYDFLAPAPGQAHNAWERQQASEAWTAQAHCDPPESASHQYAAFFAQGMGTADARVSGDIIDPAEAPFTKQTFSLWSGAKRDDRREHRANPAPQPARKRALQRARRRAIKNGGTWYKDRWVTPRDIGMPGEAHDMSHDTVKQLRKCLPKMPVLPPWPPKPGAPGSQQGPRMPKHGLGVLTFNLGGFSKEGFDEFQRWLHLETTRRLVHVVFLQETWRGSTEFCTADWIWVQSGRSPVVGQGVAVLLNRRFTDSASVRVAERRVGRVLMLHVPALRGHPLRRRPTTLISVYQHARFSEKTEVYDARAKIWALLHQVVAAVPRRHLLIVAGDLNTPLEHNGHLVGRGVLTPRIAPADADQLAQFLEAHSLAALNTFGKSDKSAATFLGDATQTQLDFVLTRSLQAGPLGRQAASQPQLEFFQWREGCRHVPVYAVLLDTRPDVVQAECSNSEPFRVDRQRMANEARLHPEKVQVFRQHVQEALAHSHHPVSPEKLDDILLQASATVFAGKPEAQPPNAWQQPETAIRLQDVWEHRAEHLRLAKQVRIAFLCIRYRAARSMWNFWAQYVRFQRTRKALRRTSQRLRKTKLIQQLENAEQALARHDTHAFFAVIQQLAPKQARGRVQLKGADGEMLTAEAEIDALHTYWDEVFNDGAQAHDTLLTEGISVAATEVLEVVSRLPMRKAAMPGRAPCAAWKLAAEDVAPHLHAYVQQAWAPGPVCVPLYLTEAWLHFMSKPGRTLRTPGDLRPLALQTGGGKALSRLLKNQLTPFAERAALHVPQFAYLRNRDTHSAIARALTHIDKVRSITHGGQRLSIHARKAGVQQQRCAGGATLSLDLSRAFDSVGHDVLWEALLWADVPQDLATLLMTWYRSEYALGQRGANGYTRRISITKGVKQGCVIAPTIWVILTCFVHHRLDGRLSQDWSERHATCFADDFLFQWVLESMQACKAMCTDVSVIYEVFASLGLCINSKKSAFLLKLVGTEAEAWLAKHRVLAPEGVEAKHVLRYDLFRRRDVPIKHTHVYLGIALTYDSYEEASMRHRLRLAAIQKHRLARILQGRGGLTVRCRLRLWRVAVATSMLYATHIVGLTRASLRSAHVMMTKHLRAIMKSPRHLTQENDLAFLQSISQDTPLQLVLKAIGSMLDRASTRTDFPCFAVEEVMHRLRALRCNMISLSEAPAPKGMRLTEVPDSAPVFTCQICGQQFATLHQVKNHEGRMHKVTAPTQSPLDASYIAKGGMPTCRFCGETFARWDNLRKHIQNNRCRSLRTTVKRDTSTVSEAAPVSESSGPTIVREAHAVAHSGASLDMSGPVATPLPHPPDPPNDATPSHPEPTLANPTAVPSQNIWHSAQQTALQNRDVPVVEWREVRQARTLEHIVQVPGVSASLVQTCCLCGQWVSATNGVRKHLRAAHASVWLKHEKTIVHRAKQWSKSAVSPCRLCHAIIKKPREHPASCTVFAQACLIELVCRETEGADHDGVNDHGATGADGQNR